MTHRRTVFLRAVFGMRIPSAARNASRHILPFLLLLSLNGAGQAQPYVQQSGTTITPGHAACWAITGVIYDCGAPGGGVSVVGSTTQNDFAAFNGSGSLIDSGINPSATSNWSGLQNFNGGATAPTRPLGDNTIYLATTAFVQQATPVSVLTCGADPTGVADSAPAFRSCIASNRVLTVPAGTYSFCSTVSPPSYLSAFLNPAVLVTGVTNFAMFGYGATINICPAIAYSTAIQFDQSTNIAFKGFTINPNASGLTGMETSTGVSLSNVVGADIGDITFGPNLTAQAFYMDWVVNAVFSHITIVAGNCFDTGFLLHVKFDDVNQTAGAAGIQCFDIVNDTPNSTANRTGISYTETDDVSVTRFDASGNDTGAYITSGKHIKFSHNNWHNNPGGQGGSGAGVGIFIQYVNGGTFTSVGVQPSGIVIDGDIFANNGTVNAGQGILLDASQIANSDTLTNIIINNSVFDNNTATGIAASGTTHYGNVAIGAGNVFSGANQSVAMNPDFLAIATSLTGLTSANGVIVTGSPTYGLTFNTATPSTGIDILLANNASISSVNGNTTSVLNLMFLDTSNFLHLGFGGTSAIFGGTIYLPGGSTGTTQVVTANNSATNYTLTLPAITDTLVTLTASQTLTNKTLTAATLGGLSTFTGQFISTFGTPTIASGACGATTNGAIAMGSTNQSGQVTIGSATTTSCTISFSTTITAPGACVIFPENATAAATGTTVARVSAVGTTSWTITGSNLASANYYYICI
jgi:hypothetical protein